MSMKPAWLVLGASVRGAGHTRAQRPNQDAIAWHTPTTPDDCLVLAVSDGHGSPRYVRSHRGAKLAVKLAVDLLHQFGTTHKGPGSIAATGDMAVEQLPRTLVRNWQATVREELAAKPLTLEEETALAEAQRTRVKDDDPLRVYGATLLTALITPHYLLLLQLGDGDIVTVDATGQVGRPPLPADPRLIANQTTSLCGGSAWRDMRTVFQPIMGRPPALVMLATDGYANSFADEAGFLAVAADILSALRTQGHRHTENQLPRWLRATSQGGSGDDISVGLAYHANSL